VQSHLYVAEQRSKLHSRTGAFQHAASALSDKGRFEYLTQFSMPGLVLKVGSVRPSSPTRCALHRESSGSSSGSGSRIKQQRSIVMCPVRLLASFYSALKVRYRVLISRIAGAAAAMPSRHVCSPALQLPCASSHPSSSLISVAEFHRLFFGSLAGAVRPWLRALVWCCGEGTGFR
jgi:hypothetical protein